MNIANCWDILNEISQKHKPFGYVILLNSLVSKNDLADHIKNSYVLHRKFFSVFPIVPKCQPRKKKGKTLSSGPRKALIECKLKTENWTFLCNVYYWVIPLRNMRTLGLFLSFQPKLHWKKYHSSNSSCRKPGPLSELALTVPWKCTGHQVNGTPWCLLGTKPSPTSIFIYITSTPCISQDGDVKIKV